MVDDALLEAVAAAVVEVADEVIVPRHRALAEGEVSEKGPGDLVTVADTEAEARLTTILPGLLPGSTVVGEEAVAADPTVLARAQASGGGRVWVVDPVDGTANFVAGSPDVAVMVALVEDGRTTASWIHHPFHRRTYTAVLGGGAWVDGRRLVRDPASEDPGELRVCVLTRLLDDVTAARVAERAGPLGVQVPNRGAAGIQYPLVAEGELDAVLLWRTLVWDHAPGALLLAEAGGLAARLDGSPYEPWSDRRGLVLAADPGTHGRVCALLAPGGEL